MMNMSEFVDFIKENIKDYLPEMYAEATVGTEKIRKNNDIVRDALTIRREDINVAPTIYLDDYFKEYKDGRELRDIMHDIAEVQQKYDLDTDIDVSKFMDLGFAKERIVPRIINASMNKELLKGRPFTMIEDLAVTYHIEIAGSDNGKMTTPITNEILKNYGITVEELHSIAMSNIIPVMKPTFMSMREMLGMMLADDMGEEMLPKDDGQMFILSSSDKCHGASAMLDPSTMDMIQKKLGSFYILPSSVHEVILLKDDGNASIEDLENLIEEVNYSQVSEAERLSGHVYRYDKKSKRITMAVAA